MGAKYDRVVMLNRWLHSAMDHSMILTYEALPSFSTSLGLEDDCHIILACNRVGMP